MARRAFVWLLPTFLALVLAFGAAASWSGPASARSIAHDIQLRVDRHAAVLTSGPLHGSNAATLTGCWSDDDDPHHILQANAVILSAPPLTAGVGRRVSRALLRQHLVSSAFPRGPPAA